MCLCAMLCTWVMHWMLLVWKKKNMSVGCCKSSVCVLLFQFSNVKFGHQTIGCGMAINAWQWLQANGSILMAFPFKIDIDTIFVFPPYRRKVRRLILCLIGFESHSRKRIKSLSALERDIQMTPIKCRQMEMAVWTTRNKQGKSNFEHLRILMGFLICVRVRHLLRAFIAFVQHAHLTFNCTQKPLP